ncbi:hypothetical protein ILP97_05940 [Amycolatopsis sp. H6(2020)]|nr:hypothetical protein [Amycolatopsis sp. H6(2020)]
MVLRKILTVAITSLALLSAGLTTSASAAPMAPRSLAECPSGYGCLYKGWNWESHPFVYYHYGYYNLTGVSGAWRAYNNQTGTATMWLCWGLNGTNCPTGLKLDPGEAIDVLNMQYFPSIKLER